MDIYKSLKIVFLIHALIAVLVGLQHMIAPQLPGVLAGVQLPAPILYRILGAAVFAFGVSSWMAFRQEKWAHVRIVVVMEIVWSGLGAIIITGGILAGLLPQIEWANAILLFLFAIVFIFFYFRQARPPESKA